MELHDIKSILNTLPHRYPFLMVDRVLEIIPGVSIKALKNVTVNEPFFTGHFPELPVMPGVMILEALGQVSGILAFKSVKGKESSDKKTALFAGVDDARFKKVVFPGDQLILISKLIRVRKGIWKCETEALVNNEIVCSATLLGATREFPRD